MLTVRGRTDDDDATIEVAGDICDVWPLPDMCDDALIACSDGTLMRGAYDDGQWRITVVQEGTCRVRVTAGDCSDVVMLDGYPVKWVMCGVTATTGAGRL